MERLRDHISRFVTLTDAEWTVVRKKMTLIEARKRDVVLVNKENICDKHFFVLRGCLRAYEFNMRGEEYNLAFAVENDWITDLGAFLNVTPGNYVVDSMEDSYVLSLEKENYDIIISDMPKMERYFRLLVQNSYLELQKRVLFDISMGAEERYINFLDNYPLLERRIPQYHIASYLGITPESLSRIRRKILGISKI